MTKHRKITYASHFKGLPIQTVPEKNLGCREDILQTIRSLMLCSISKGRRMFTRFDLRYPEGFYPPDSNDDIQKFFNTFMVNLKRLGLKKTDYIWVREQSRDKHQHYHCFIMTKATDQIPFHFKNYKSLLGIADNIWCRLLGLNGCKSQMIGNNFNRSGLVDDCDRKNYPNLHDKNGITLYKNGYGSTAFNSCHWVASYLAKARTKGYSNGYNEVGHSQIPAEFKNI